MFTSTFGLVLDNYFNTKNSILSLELSYWRVVILENQWIIQAVLMPNALI